MRQIRLSLAALFVALTVAACSGDVTGPSTEPVQGACPVMGSGTGTC